MNYTKHFTVIMALLFLASGGAKAQGGFGAPILKITSLNGQTGLMIGGMGAARYNHFYFGGIGAGLANGERFSLDTETGTVSDLSMGYGGLLFGYMKPIATPLSLYAQGIMAWGSYEWEDIDEGTNFFMLEPELGFNIHSGRSFTLGLGVSYRFGVPISAKSAYELDSFNGLNASLSFKFGNVQTNNHE